MKRSEQRATRRLRRRRAGGPAAVGLCALLAAGCENLLDSILNPAGRPEPDIAILAPASNQTLQVGATITVAWSDIAYEPGTVVAVEGLRLTTTGDDVTEVTQVAVNLDAFADGDGDIFELDSTNVAPGRYRYRVTISSPDGFSNSDVSVGVVTLN